MNLREPLSALVASARDSVAAAVIDELGETVELVSSGAREEDVGLLAAYLGLSSRRIDEGLDRAGAGRTVSLEQDRGALRCHLRTLPHGYALILVQNRPGLSGEAERSMRRAGEAIAHALFPERADV